MPLPIQALPKGLVSYLDLSTGGAGPGHLADQIVATIGVDRLFEAYKRERTFETGLAIGTTTGPRAFSTVLTPPGNEAWLIYNYTVFTTCAIGVSASIVAAYQSAALGTVTSICVGEPASTSISAIASVLVASARNPFVLLPGQTCSMITLGISAAVALSATGSIDFVRLRL